MEKIEIAFIVAVFIAISFGIGALIAAISMQEECDLLHKTSLFGEVYECRKIETPDD